MIRMLKIIIYRCCLLFVTCVDKKPDWGSATVKVENKLTTELLNVGYVDVEVAKSIASGETVERTIYGYFSKFSPLTFNMRNDAGVEIVLETKEEFIIYEGETITITITRDTELESAIY